MGCEKCHASGINKSTSTYCDCGYGKVKKQEDLNKSHSPDLVKRFNDFDLKK